MGRNSRSSATHPPWAARLETPVWITGPNKTLVWMNAAGASLLGASLPASVGRPCHEIVNGCDDSGRAVCSPECPLWRKARTGEGIAPVRLAVGSAGAPRRWTRIILIPVRRPGRGGTCLVHCAVIAEREFRMERYLEKVAARWAGYRKQERLPPSGALTAREREILGRLTADEDLHAIAGGLGIRYVTVRNHVQHIRGKLRVRSIAEAAARAILEGEAETGVSHRRRP